MYKILLTNLFIENKKVLKPYFDSEFFYFHFRENICVRYGANFLVKQKKRRAFRTWYKNKTIPQRVINICAQNVKSQVISDRISLICFSG